MIVMVEVRRWGVSRWLVATALAGLGVVLTTSAYFAALYRDTYPALVALPVLMAIALSILTLNAFIRKGFEDVRGDLRELANRSVATPTQVTGEDSLYQTGVEYLRANTFNTMRAYAPGAFAIRNMPGQIGPKEKWIREIGTALKKRRLKNFYYVIGLSKNDEHRECVLDFLYNAIIKPIEAMKGDWPQIEIRYVALPAEDVTGAGIGFVTFDNSAFLLCCGTEPSKVGGPSLLQHAWLWNDDAVTADLAERMSAWFDQFALPRSRVLWAPPVTEYAIGRADCNAYFAHLPSSSLPSQQAEAVIQLPT